MTLTLRDDDMLLEILILRPPKDTELDENKV